MEYCQFTLADYIERPDIVLESWWVGDLDNYPNDNAKRWNRIGGIMRDILSGLAFIHSRKEVHRDLKPRNSLLPAITSLTASPVFANDQRMYLENNRLWIHCRGFIKENNLQLQWQRYIGLSRAGTCTRGCLH